MSKENNGGPAYPIPMIPCDNNGGFTDVKNNGMTLRDYFAGQVIGECFRRHFDSPHRAACVAYEFADAMLKARDK